MKNQRKTIKEGNKKLMKINLNITYVNEFLILDEQIKIKIEKP